MDEILGYLLDDLDALKACSLTHKRLFDATRPFIHQWLCLASRVEHPKPKGPLFSGRKRGNRAFGHGAFERLIDADRLGLLHHTRYLTFRITDGSFNPGNVQGYLPYLRTITKLHSLTLDTFRVSPFVPTFKQCFGMFSNALRHLEIRHVLGTGRQLLYIICQFPLLEDLSIISPSEAIIHGHPVPPITQSPTFRGKLALADMHSRGLLEGLVALPGGLNFCSLELFRCEDLQDVLAACGHTVTSLSYLLCVWGSDDSESDLIIQVHTPV